MKTDLEYLKTTYKDILAIHSATATLSWDQEVMMPEKGAQQRAEALSVLASLAHEKTAHADIGKALEGVDPAQLDAEDAADFREIKKAHQHAIRLPKALVAKLAKTTSLAHGAWAKARAASDFAQFQPVLQEVVTLRREEADYLKDDGESPYDCMLNLYEPGMNAREISALFEPTQIALKDLVQSVPTQSTFKMVGDFPKDKQIVLAHKLAEIFHFPRDAGRIDLSTHPFSSGAFDDVRITTRIDESDPLGAIYSTIHEIGHALYEHQIDRKRQGRAHGIYASMGMHESQSRFAENQIGRSRAFMEVLSPLMIAAFGAGDWADPSWLYRAVNHVENGFIRTEADELHYNLHIFLRFGLERDLFAGDIRFEDLEPEWNKRFAELFGRVPPTAAQGILQDIHWSMGVFGYFPTYALGNIYAACLEVALRKAHPNMDARIAKGDLEFWRKWMGENIHQYGRLLDTPSRIKAATGEAVTTQPLINALSAKFEGYVHS